MKKWILMSALALTAPLLVQAQDDDMYFVPTEENVAQQAQSYGLPNKVYYSGSNRSVDDYNNRRVWSRVAPIDSAGNDVIDFSAELGVYPDSAFADVNDYQYTQQMSRFDGYQPADSFWSGYYAGRSSAYWGWADPWYYHSWYYDPWYYGGYGYYGYYSPWYYSWYGPHYGWGWYGPRYYYGGYYGGLYAHRGIHTGGRGGSRGAGWQSSRRSFGAASNGRSGAVQRSAGGNVNNSRRSFGASSNNSYTPQRSYGNNSNSSRSFGGSSGGSFGGGRSGGGSRGGGGGFGRHR